MSTNQGGDYGGGGDAGPGGGYVNPSFPRRPTGTAAVRRSRSYGRPYPIVYGTAAVLGVPLWVYDKGDASVALDGANPGDMRVAEVQYAFGFGPVTSIDGIIYEKRSYRTGGLDPKHLSGRDGATWPYPPEFYVGDGTTTAWAHYSGSDASTRIPWRKLALMRCQRFGVPGGAGTTPEIRALVRGKFATHSNTKRNEDGGWTRYDAAPGDVIRDLLENTTYGMGLASGTVVTAVGADGLAASSYDRYCEQSGWWVALAIDGAASVADIVEQVLTATNSVGMWTGGKFKIVPLGDVAVGTYSPVLTALAITNDDFVCERDEDAISTTCQAWEDTWNTVEVEYSADTALRDAELVTTESPDVANASVWGVRRAPEVVSLPCIRSKKHAQEISGILARRSCYHRSRFEFRVSIRHGAALEVGDLVALTHDVMGFSNRLARVDLIEARPDGTYRVEAQEWVTGASVTVLTTPEGALGLGNNPVPDRDVNASAAAAVAAISDMVADGKLTPAEKTGFCEAMSKIANADASHYSVIKAKLPTGAGTPRKDYEDAIAALSSFLATFMEGIGLSHYYPTASQAQKDALHAWMLTTSVIMDGDQAGAEAMRFAIAWVHSAQAKVDAAVAASAAVALSALGSSATGTSGTPSSTTYLRGDGTWATPPVAGAPAWGDITGKPTFGTAAALDVPAAGNAASGQVVKGSDTRLTDARAASDVSAWAKAASKPSYTYSEIGSTPASLPASDVYAWAKAATKPTYTAAEVGALASGGKAADSDLLDGQHITYFQPASTAITTSNIGSQSVSYATTAGSATSAGSISGYGNPATTATASTIAYRDTNGWLFCVDLSTSSDRRTKRKIRNLRDALGLVLRLRGKSYYRKGDKKKTRRIGLIAQEVREVVPEVVVEDEKGMLSISYGPLVALLIEALRAIVRRLDRLEARR